VTYKDAEFSDTLTGSFPTEVFHGQGRIYIHAPETNHYLYTALQCDYTLPQCTENELP